MWVLVLITRGHFCFALRLASARLFHQSIARWLIFWLDCPEAPPPLHLVDQYITRLTLEPQYTHTCLSRDLCHPLVQSPPSKSVPSSLLTITTLPSPSFHRTPHAGRTHQQQPVPKSMEPSSPPAPPTTTARRRRGRRIGRLPGLSSSSPIASLPLLLVLLLCLLCLLLLPVPSHGATTTTSTTQTKTKKKQKPVVSLSSEELLDHLEEWTTDVAIFFYAPWCPYCK